MRARAQVHSNPKRISSSHGADGLPPVALRARNAKTRSRSGSPRTYSPKTPQINGTQSVIATQKMIAGPIPDLNISLKLK